MIAKRLLAVLVAVGLVAGAWVLRGQLQGDDEPGTAGPDDPPAESEVVWCVAELAAACEVLADDGYEVEVAPAGEQALAFRSPTTPDVAAWVTLDPWPEIVDTYRDADNLEPLFGSVEPIASSQLGLVGPADRMTVLEEACGGALTWRCVGEQAGLAWTELGGPEAWLDVKPAHASPVDSAVGLAVLGQAAGSWFAGEDPPVPAEAINPFDFEGPFRDWFDQLERAIPDDAFESSQTPLEILLTQPVFDVVGTTAAEAGAAVPPRYSVTYPDPVVSASAVVASAEGGGLPGGDVARATEALAAAGWTNPASPPPSGLPSAAVLISLQDLWTEVRG